jgi:peptidoglycan hydrolase CwlO-like protein
MILKLSVQLEQLLSHPGNSFLFLELPLLGRVSVEFNCPRARLSEEEETPLNVIETLQSEHADLTQRLTELDDRHRNERPTLVAQISQLNKAIAALTKPATVPGERKPMSEAGKAAIKAGLEKARAAKAAAANPAAAKTPATTTDVVQPEGDKPSGTTGTPVATRKFPVN